MGNGRFVELGWFAKLAGVGRGGLANVVMLAINVPPKALASLFCALAAENPPSPLSVVEVAMLACSIDEYESPGIVVELVSSETASEETTCGDEDDTSWPGLVDIEVDVDGEALGIVMEECGNESGDLRQWSASSKKEEVEAFCRPAAAAAPPAWAWAWA
ncbi:hypothetical protein O1611_g9105 [Lasiodiplodia mahajangana]|uniref:Uncharacterized protein n=1 Tax=Lasiodiplodia mahajangana TaxID=1108764 RepID=A0ACC2JAN3_9PEZI|nr:hypothetical protein O1611_g9105 [Lasiodiplodia mahajangana]